MGFFDKVKKAAKSAAKKTKTAATKGLKVAKAVASNKLVKQMVKTGVALTPAGQALSIANKLGGKQLLKGALRGDLKGGLKDAVKSAVKKNLGVKLNDAKKYVGQIKKNITPAIRNIETALDNPVEYSNDNDMQDNVAPLIVQPIEPEHPMIQPEEIEYHPVVVDREISRVQVPYKSNMSELVDKQLAMVDVDEPVFQSPKRKAFDLLFGGLFG